MTTLFLQRSNTSWSSPLKVRFLKKKSKKKNNKENDIKKIPLLTDKVNIRLPLERYDFKFLRIGTTHTLNLFSIGFYVYVYLCMDSNKIMIYNQIGKILLK